MEKYKIGKRIDENWILPIHEALNVKNGTSNTIVIVPQFELDFDEVDRICTTAAKIMKLNAFPSVLQCIESFRDDEKLYFVCEAVETTMMGILKSFGVFPEKLLSFYVKQLVNGLIYLNDNGFHYDDFDISPHHILITSDGQVKLLPPITPQKLKSNANLRDTIMKLLSANSDEISVECNDFLNLCLTAYNLDELLQHRWLRKNITNYYTGNEEQVLSVNKEKEIGKNDDSDTALSPVTTATVVTTSASSNNSTNNNSSLGTLKDIKATLKLYNTLKQQEPVMLTNIDWSTLFHAIDDVDDTNNSSNSANNNNSQPEKDQSSTMTKAIVKFSKTTQQKLPNSKQIFTMYQVDVSFKNDVWIIYKRYNDFLELHNKLLKAKISPKVKFPPKKLFDNFNPTFIECRRKDLEQYLKSIVDDFGDNDAINRFLYMPIN